MPQCVQLAGVNWGAVCCRILKARAEESGEYLCVFVFSGSPVANATIEVRGTAATLPVPMSPSLGLQQLLGLQQHLGSPTKEQRAPHHTEPGLG